eukprot:SAG31_NODE_640_length_13322_cov_4.396703_5_plen_243_part_00
MRAEPDAVRPLLRVVTFSFLCPLLEKYGTFIARCNALIEKVSSFSAEKGALLCNTIPRCAGEFLLSGAKRVVTRSYVAHTGTILHALVNFANTANEDDVCEKVEQLLLSLSADTQFPRSIVRADIMDEEGRYPHQLTELEHFPKLKEQLEWAYLQAEREAAHQRHLMRKKLQDRVKNLKNALEKWGDGDDDGSMMMHDAKQAVRNCLRQSLTAANELEAMKESSVSINQVRNFGLWMMQESV